jgi:Zn-dependent protease with chaperone function
MDFFEAQARAKKRTARLVTMFILAVIGTIVAMYFAALLIFSQAGHRHSHRWSRYDYYAPPDDVPTEVAVWQPSLFAGVAFTTIAVVAIGSLYKWSQFSAGGSAVAESVGARRVDPATRDLHERKLLNVVEEMAIASGVPVPAVYVLDEEPGINAFAAGLTTSDAVVTVTRGTLEKLNRDELQGVIGHEFSHILNGDMRLNLRIAATIFGILALGLLGRGVLWSLSNVRVSSRRDRNGGGIVVALLAIGVALVVIGYVGYFFGRLIQAAVSRQREFLADASSVQFTRNPAGITGALKKIGGYELGSTMAHNQSAAIGHFFFAQGFRTGITGLWATHPPLEDRIRAVDPQWDGQFVAPQDVGTEKEPASPARPATPPAPLFDPVATVIAASALPAATPPMLSPGAATAAVSAIGKLTPAQIANAQLLLESTPARLRTAAQTPTEVRVLLFGLLLDRDAEIRNRQRSMVASRAGAEALRMLDELDAALRELRDEHRLPLLQIALPVLRSTPKNDIQRFLETLDELITADGRISPFELAMEKMLKRTLALGRAPSSAAVQVYSFEAVAGEIATVLSVLASESTSDPAGAAQAFAVGAAQLKLIETHLTYRPEEAGNLDALDAALEKLATASLPIRQRTLVAAAHVVQADGQVLVTEFELLRAFAAALDVPMPPLATSVPNAA